MTSTVALERRKSDPRPGVEPARVLLVEDEPLISEWVAEALSDQGFAVLAAGNAADALQCLAETPVDLLFTDVNLPGAMDGAALARQARDMFPDLAVAYTSGLMNMFDPGRRVPRSVFVAKPYVPSVVARLLADFLDTAAPHARA